MLTWKPPLSGSSPVAYLIFRNSALTDLIGIVPAEQLFQRPQSQKNHIYTYFVVSVDEKGNFSSPAEVVVVD
ncbi:MAG: hypothetical protein HWD61_08835 [Parachlamydiaceae bacterium]|nr:MAG: hypothetical protein HWD61_08835 [Parachlamydiaceae bacterium]